MMCVVLAYWEWCIIAFTCVWECESMSFTALRHSLSIYTPLTEFEQMGRCLVSPLHAVLPNPSPGYVFSTLVWPWVELGWAEWGESNNMMKRGWIWARARAGDDTKRARQWGMGAISPQYQQVQGHGTTSRRKEHSSWASWDEVFLEFVR